MGTPIESSSLVFTTREFYLSGSTDSAKGSTLTFEELDNTLIFLSSSITSIEGTYSSSFPDNTQTPKAVGGINSGSTAGNLKGKTFSQMFDLLLFPVINPTATQGTFSSTTGFTYKEIGDIISVTVTSTFSKGAWQVVGQSPRDYYGAATNFYFSSSAGSEINNNTTNQYAFDNYAVAEGTNNFPTAVSHSAGQQPLNSDGSNFSTPIAAGKLTDPDVSFEGIYPWFYGSSSADTLSAAEVVTAIENIYVPTSTNAVRNVELSSGTITASYPGTTNYWLWFAIPSANSKTKWYQNNFNSGDIGGASNTFGSPTTTLVDTYVNNVSYKIYITNFKTNFGLGINAGTVQFEN